MDTKTSETPLAPIEGSEKRKNGNSKALPVPLIVMALLIIGSLTWHFFLRPSDPQDRLFVSGRIEGYETNIGAKIGGRVDSILFREGALVEAGQLVARLSDDDIQAQLRQAKARLEAAESMVAQRLDGLESVKWHVEEAKLQLNQSSEDSDARIQQSEASVAQAAAELKESESRLKEAKFALELAGKRKERFEKLIGPGAVTKDEYDEAITNFMTAGASVESREAMLVSARKKLRAAEALLAQARAVRFTPGIRKTQLHSTERQLAESSQQLETARADVKAARAQVEEIEARIAYLNLNSPIRGVVTARPVEPGAVVVAGQTVLSLIDLENVYLRGFVPEGKVGSIKIGQTCESHLDSFPDKPFSGKLIEIDPVGSFTPENIYFKDDRVKQVFGIKIAVENPEGFVKPGMPADALIHTDLPSHIESGSKKANAT